MLGSHWNTQQPLVKLELKKGPPGGEGGMIPFQIATTRTPRGKPIWMTSGPIAWKQPTTAQNCLEAA
eukprot:1032485-Alexandrium_andersonii.AAC.1